MNMTRKNILSVDDEPVILNAIKASVDGEKYKFIGVTSCKSALRYLDTNAPPDLILLDVEMPEMNGYDLIKLLKNKEETARIPVIFLTANSDEENELEGLSSGAIDYITKPFSPPLLLKRIDVHLLVEAQKRELINFNNNLRQMVEAETKTVVELKNAVLKIMAELVEYRDGITGGHIERTQEYLNVMLNALLSHGVYEKEILLWNMGFVLQSAQLHDVGKIAIRDYILRKPCGLTDEEFAQMKEHTIFGKAIIEKIQNRTTEKTFLEYAKTFAVAHHEKWDGTGYPYGLKGKKIPLLGRIMAIADVYDALVSERPYKRALSHREAVNIILDGKGAHFDPVLVDSFLTVSDNFEKISTNKP